MPSVRGWKKVVDEKDYVIYKNNNAVVYDGPFKGASWGYPYVKVEKDYYTGNWRAQLVESHYVEDIAYGRRKDEVLRKAISWMRKHSGV
jgi:hypothetical protein